MVSKSNTMAETPSHFFKVILPATLEDKKLRIPEMFIRKFGDELSAVATLKVPNGHIWQVGLTKDGRKVWFHDGWHDFVEYHSIDAGYFLVFKYEKNSNFHVLIFDMSACEIQYPYNGKVPKNDGKNSVNRDEMESQDSVSVTSFSLRNKVFHECPSKSLSNKMYTQSMENQAKSPFGSNLRTNSSRKCATTLDSSKFMHSHEVKSKKCKTEEVVVMNELDDVNESRKCKLNKNRMHNSQRSLHCKRHLDKNPENFAPSPLAQDMDSDNERTKFKKTRHYGKDKHQSEVIGSDSELKNAADRVDTHASGEANKGTKFDKKGFLAVFEDMGISISQKYGSFSAEERDRAINVARNLKPKNPSFMIMLRSDNIKDRRVYLPLKFANKHLGKVTKSSTLQHPDGREWPVKITFCTAGCFIRTGWAKFSNDMNLKEGDICVFELIRKKDFLLKVSVFQVPKK